MRIPNYSEVLGQSKRKVNVKINTCVYEDLKTNADRKGLSVEEYLIYLEEFHNLVHLDKLIERIRIKVAAGLTALQIAQLSVLYTYLQYLKEKIGFR